MKLLPLVSAAVAGCLVATAPNIVDATATQRGLLSDLLNGVYISATDIVWDILFGKLATTTTTPVRVRCVFDHDEGTYVNIRKKPCGDIVGKAGKDDYVWITEDSKKTCDICMPTYDECWVETRDGNWVASKFLTCKAQWSYDD